MQAPKRKTSKSKRNMRRSHHHATAGTPGECPNCSAQVLPHHICPSCGQYRGRQILEASSAD